MKKKAYVLLAEGFEEVEALTVVDYLRRAGIEVQTLSITADKTVAGSHRIPVVADALFAERSDDFDLVVLPGGLPGAENLRDCTELIELLQKADEQGKLIAAICAAPIILEKAGLTAGRKGTSYPGFEEQLSYAEYLDEIVVVDQHLITSRGPAAAVYFALTLIELLLGKAKREEIADGLLLPFIHARI